MPTRPAHGKCEVVVFTQDPLAALGKLALPDIELLFDVWAEGFGMIGPGQFVADFGHLPIARVV